jgi:CRP/FNR family transcriptional regulator, anaerobic regulatory protein
MFVSCTECPLRQKPFFRSFSNDELAVVAKAKSDHISAPPRADIIRADEVGGPVYTLFEGWAIRYHRLPSGGRQILDIVLPGDLIGLASALLGMIRHSVQAVTPVTLCVLRSQFVAEMFERHPGLALSIMRTRIEEEHRADTRITLLGRNSAEQRIAHLMLETFDRLRQRRIVDDGSTCPFPLQRHHIADATGLSRVHVARTLEALRERRLAEIQNGVLVLYDRARLADLVGYEALHAPPGQRAIL